MLAAVIDRLEEIGDPVTSVEAAESLESIAKGSAPKTGAVFVIPWSERGKPNSLMAGGFRQVVDLQILVAFVIRQHGDVKGGARALQYEALKGAIEAKLAGWAPTDESELFEFVGQESLPLGNAQSNATIFVQTWQSTRDLTGA